MMYELSDDELDALKNGCALYIDGHIVGRPDELPSNGLQCKVNGHTITRLEDGEVVTWSGDGRDLKLKREGLQPSGKEHRRLIESLSFVGDHVNTMIGEATKLLTYGSDMRQMPVENIRNEIESMRELLDEIEEQLDDLS